MLSIFHLIYDMNIECKTYNMFCFGFQIYLQSYQLLYSVRVRWLVHIKHLALYKITTGFRFRQTWNLFCTRSTILLKPKSWFSVFILIHIDGLRLLLEPKSWFFTIILIQSDCPQLLFEPKSYVLYIRFDSYWLSSLAPSFRSLLLLLYTIFLRSWSLLLIWFCAKVGFNLCVSDHAECNKFYAQHAHAHQLWHCEGKLSFFTRAGLAYWGGLLYARFTFHLHMPSSKRF